MVQLYQTAISWCSIAYLSHNAIVNLSSCCLSVFIPRLAQYTEVDEQSNEEAEYCLIILNFRRRVLCCVCSDIVRLR